MRVRTVVGDDGRTWSVRRRWSPRPGVRPSWERARRRTKRSTDGATTAGDVSLVSALLIQDGAVLLRWAIIAVVAVVLLFVTTFLLAVELAVLALVVLMGVTSRILLRKPWTVEAVSDTGDRLTWTAVGWRASTARRDEIAGLLRAGITPPSGDPAEAGPA
jgi:hypothetical protein